MTLRLELKPTHGFPQGEPRQRWYFETGSRTVGRASDCDWQIPDPKRTISKVHCVIESDRDGFLLRDKSANGTRVDGVIVHEAETARLDAGSVVELGGFSLVVAMSGERDADHDDPDADLALDADSLTISSILSDIAPSSRSASGLRGGVTSDPDWLSASSPRETPNPDAPSSRNVAIGWDGAPDTGGFNVLPDDWHVETGTSSRFEHVSATRAPIPLKRNRPVEEPAAADTPERTDAAPEPAEPLVVTGATHVNGAVASAPDLRRLEALLARCEEANADLLARLDMAGAEDAFPRGLFSNADEDVMAARLEALLRKQARLATALDGMFAHATRHFDPSVLESRIDAEPRRFAWRGDRTYWQAYCAQFDDEGGRLSVRDVLCEGAFHALRNDDAGETTPDDDREVDPHP
ncbi:FHA domain-containing protein [Mesorhizobium sp. CAU 1732]|uniref:type VI secretion system-associated FHA domain protein n=1 Tax=Mesorhizobium sp. CAU 1732 TaxID=3140358 RepID=UPI0032604123